VDIKDLDKIDFKKEIRSIRKLFDAKDYFEVVILSVQLLDLISVYILQSLEQESLESVHDGLDEAETKKWFSVYKEYASNVSKHRGRDSAKIKLTEVLFQDFEYLKELHVTPALFHKVNRICQFRNKLAHEYYLNPRTRGSLRIRAKDCLDVLEKFYNHIYF